MRHSEAKKRYSWPDERLIQTQNGEEEWIWEEAYDRKRDFAGRLPITGMTY